MDKDIHLVTGAFGYLGKYITHDLLDAGCKVRTITNSPNRTNPFGDRIETRPYYFDNQTELEKSFENVKVFYNTFWIRFAHSGHDFNWVLKNTEKLVIAAKKANVQRIIHISVMNCDKNSPYDYYRSKALGEEIIKNSGISYVILKPAIIFGEEDILINNIAWSLRHLPVFGIFGSGKYKISPVYVRDLASLAVQYGTFTENVSLDVTGPGTFEYKQMVKMLAQKIAVKRLILPMPNWAGLLFTRFLGLFLKDIFVTKQEALALTDGLLSTVAQPLAETKLTDWIEEHKQTLGQKYSSELTRRTDRTTPYSKI